MSVFILSFVVLALAVAGMAVGVLLGRRPLSGSCGGLGPGGTCRLCREPCERAKT